MKPTEMEFNLVSYPVKKIRFRNEPDALFFEIVSDLWKTGKLGLRRMIRHNITVKCALNCTRYVILVIFFTQT